MCEHLAVSCGLDVRAQRGHEQESVLPAERRKGQLSGRGSDIVIITPTTGLVSKLIRPRWSLIYLMSEVCPPPFYEIPLKHDVFFD